MFSLSESFGPLAELDDDEELEVYHHIVLELLAPATFSNFQSVRAPVSIAELRRSIIGLC